MMIPTEELTQTALGGPSLSPFRTVKPINKPPEVTTESKQPEKPRLKM